MANETNRMPLDAATEITVAWLQRTGSSEPDSKKVGEFLLEVYKTAWKAVYGSNFKQQELENL